MNVLAFMALTAVFLALIIEFCYILLRNGGWRDRVTRYGTALFAFTMAALFLVISIRLTGIAEADLNLVALLLVGVLFGTPGVYAILRVAFGGDGTVQR